MSSNIFCIKTQQKMQINYKIFIIVLILTKFASSKPLTNSPTVCCFLTSINSLIFIKSETISAEDKGQNFSNSDEEESILDKIAKDFGKLAHGAADLANDFKEFSSVLMKK